MAALGCGILFLAVWGVAVMFINTLRILKPYDKEFVWTPLGLVRAVWHDLRDYN
jgi:hypothetical protein